MTHTQHAQIRQELKTLLFLLARESDSPGNDLQELLHEVINELHDLVVENMKERTRLKLIASNE